MTTCVGSIALDSNPGSHFQFCLSFDEIRNGKSKFEGLYLTLTLVPIITVTGGTASSSNILTTGSCKLLCVQYVVQAVYVIDKPQ